MLHSLKERKRMMRSECKRTQCPTLVQSSSLKPPILFLFTIHPISYQFSVSSIFIPSANNSLSFQSSSLQLQYVPNIFLFSIHPSNYRFSICSVFIPSPSNYLSLPYSSLQLPILVLFSLHPFTYQLSFSSVVIPIVSNSYSLQSSSL